MNQGTRSQGSGDRPEGWGVEGGGRGFGMGDPWAPRADSCLCMAKTATML